MMVSSGLWSDCTLLGDHKHIGGSALVHALQLEVLFQFVYIASRYP